VCVCVCVRALLNAREGRPGVSWERVGEAYTCYGGYGCKQCRKFLLSTQHVVTV
jgi:hypothetical protein